MKSPVIVSLNVSGVARIDWSGQAAPLEVPVGEDPSVLAATLQSSPVRDADVILTLPTAWCLPATIATADLPKRSRHRLMLYRFEEQLPLAAEDVSASFCPALDGGHQLAIAAETQRVLPFVRAIEQTGGQSIRAIVPTSLLALQALLAESPSDTGKLDFIVWQEQDAIEIFELDRSQIAGWGCRQASPEAILPQLLTKSSTRPLQCLAIGLDSTLADTLTEDDRLQVELCPPTTMASISAGAIARLANGKSELWADLRSGALASADPVRPIRTPLSWAVAASILLTLCLCGSMIARARSYDAQATTDQRQLDAIYRDLMGRDPAGADVRARLASEERKLRAVRGTDIAEAPTSALTSFADVLKSLPRNGMRYRVLDLRVDPAGLSVAGQARSHSDADLIATAIRGGSSFNVEAPRTETRGDDGSGISFIIAANAVNQGERK